MSDNPNDAGNGDEAVRASTPHPLERYSLKGQSAELKQRAGDTKYVLPGIAASGQLTLINAPPNSGKTLSAKGLLRSSCAQRFKDGDRVFYVNADDNLEGLAIKTAIAEQIGVDMLADGHKGFKAGDILPIIDKIISSGAARGTTIILDTGKKFTNPMDKTASSQFTGKLRTFVMAGGTAIVLAHVNKRPGPNGELIEAGVSDFKDDADSQYFIHRVLETPDGLRRVIRFEQTKSRGYGEREVFFEYSIDPELSYEAIVTSFRRLDDAEVKTLMRDASFNEDETIIEAIESELQKGPQLKMVLLKAARQAAGASRREVEQVLHRYTGKDAVQHRWNFTVKDRGGKLYDLLDEGIPY